MAGADGSSRIGGDTARKGLIGLVDHPELDVIQNMVECLVVVGVCGRQNGTELH